MSTPESIVATLLQLASWLKPSMDKIKPLFDQPVIRQPYSMALRTSATIGAGVSNFPLVAADFQNSLEYPFEVEEIVFSNDPSHSFRDWRVSIRDQSYAQNLHQAPVMVSTFVHADTGARALRWPWTIRPKGGLWQFMIDNLDTINPITVDVNLNGSLLIPVGSYGGR